MRKSMVIFTRIVCAAIIGYLIQGCAATTPRKCVLDAPAKQAMLREDKMNYRAIDDHVYFSKEGSSGGRGFGGGGCGCN